MKFYQRIGPIDKIRLCLLLLCALTAFPVHALDVGHRSAPVLVDIDNDGDKDIFIGESDGSINLFTNAGTAAKPAFLAQVGESDPLDGIDVGDDSDPVFVDIDNDGDQDVFIGESGGGVEYYENVGTPGDAAFEERAGALNPLDGVDVGTNNAISFADIDADGDFDAFIGESTGFILYFENIGTAASAGFQEKSSVDNPFDRIDVGSYGVPAFVDIDNDGDLDAFVGENSGIIAYFENTGTAGSPRFVPAPNPLAWVDTGSKSNPDFVDIDKDGDFDLFIGKSDGSLHFYENNGSAEAPNFVERIASALFPSVADFGLNPGDIPALDAAQISALVPQALGSFEAENVAVLSAAAVSALNAEQLANVRADALAGLTPAQFQSLSTAALSGLNAQNAGGLAADVIINFTPEAIAALDLNKVHLAAGKDIGRMLTNLGCDLISPEQAAALAPAGWKIDLSNGAITAPAGSGLGLKAVAQPADLPPEVELSELPDLDTVFGVGACWQGATQLEKLNLALADKGPGAFTFSQQQDKGGILLLTGPGLEMSFIPDASRMTQAGADAVSGVLVDENSGRITITTQDKRQFSLIPAPAEPAKLAN
ncbi:MAG: VCBS repeat-containing protein, partial [Gammaproteobacteria bacterium]|nr:VCBS repeat-containing protein [Gammaproteobacteria bacterium]